MIRDYPGEKFFEEGQTKGLSRENHVQRRIVDEKGIVAAKSPPGWIPSDA